MGDSLLTQADIDAMVKEHGGSVPPPAPKRQPAPPAPAPAPPAAMPTAAGPSVPAPAPATAPPAADTGAEKWRELDQRLSKLENMVEKLSRAMPKNEETAGRPTLDAVTRRVLELGQEIKTISTKLQGTLGYDVFHTFNCDRCHSKETVALLFRCTQCGHQSWRGWFPKQKR